MIRQRREALVVVGTGMAGVKVVEEVLTRSPDRFDIVMFGEEPHHSYNRIQLSAVVGGHKDPASILLHPPDWYRENGIRLHTGVRATRLDLANRVVVGRPAANGRSVDL